MCHSLAVVDGNACIQQGTILFVVGDSCFDCCPLYLVIRGNAITISTGPLEVAD